MKIIYWLLVSICMMLSQSAVADGNLNTKLIADFRLYPNSNAGTNDSGQSLELNIDAYKDFGAARAVLELVARFDDQDSGRRILEAPGSLAPHLCQSKDIRNMGTFKFGICLNFVN